MKFIYKYNWYKNRSGICKKSHIFVICPRPEPSNFLIKNNASVSAVDKLNRNTPLHCAVLAGNVDAAHILLSAGASVDTENINVSLRTEFILQNKRKMLPILKK